MMQESTYKSGLAVQTTGTTSLELHESSEKILAIAHLHHVDRLWRVGCAQPRLRSRAVYLYYFLIGTSLANSRTLCLLP